MNRCFPDTAKIACLVAVLVAAGSSIAAAASIEKPYACQKAKVRATARAFSCLVNEEYRALRGSVPDFAKCTGKLASAFASAELRAEGQCVSVSDAGIAQAQVEEAVDGLLDVLQASLATDTDSQRCLQKQLKLSRKYAACQADALSRRIGGSYNGLGGSYFVPCTNGIRDGLETVHANYACVVTPDYRDLTLWVGGGFAYLPSFEAVGETAQDYLAATFQHGNLTNSSFPNVQMTFVDARGTNFTGADLHDTRWHEASMAGAIMDGADLTGAWMRGTDVTDTLLADAALDGSCWEEIHYYSTGCPASMPPDWSCQAGWLLGPGIDCSASSTSSSDLDDVDFSGANLTSSDFSFRSFNAGTFAGANLSGASLARVEMTGTNLGGCDFSGTDLAVVDLRGVDLTGASMATASFDSGYENFVIRVATGCPASLPAGMACTAGAIVGPWADVSFLNLTAANLSNLELTHMDFGDANVSGVDFGTSTLQDSALFRTNVTGAQFDAANLAGAATRLLVGCPATLPASWVCLGGALLGPGSHPYYVDLSGADLSNLNLSGSTLEGVDLTGANLAGADLSNAAWWNTTCPDGTLMDEVGEKCCGHHVGSPPAVCN